MKPPQPDRIVHGAVGGVVAGVVVVVWFLVMDLVAGHPFETPARLSAAVLRAEFYGPWPRLIVLFTVLHFGVFITLGIVSSWVLDELRVEPGLLVGALFGVGVLNAVHYTGLLVTGTNLLTVVPVSQVAMANLLGGMLMMAYLHRARKSESPLGWTVLKGHPVLYEGLVVGLVGAAAVAGWFLVAHLFYGSPLYTPAALGSAVLLGATNPAEVEYSLGVMAAYTAFHLLAFAAIGIAFSWLVRQLRGAPGLGIRALVVFFLVEGLFIGSVGMASGWVVQEMGWVMILVANVLAVGVMSAWIWRQHPELAGELDNQASTA